MKNKIEIIAFDADDTLWVNELYFHQAEEQFCSLLEKYLPGNSISNELFNVEMKNLHLYGYGIKGFILSMIETASKIAGKTASLKLVDRILELGVELLQKPIELLPGVLKTLEQLNGKYKLIIATKGDLLDQERKLKKSGLEHYFHHIEIMSDKKTGDYQRLMKYLDVKPKNFLMLGNSIKSDILPVLDLGGFACHIPYKITWKHEQNEHAIHHENLIELETIDKVLNHLN